MSKQTPNSSRPSPFGAIFDSIMSVAAAISNEPKRATEPYAKYGIENLEETSGRAPQVRTYLQDATVNSSLNRIAAGTVGNIFMWQQPVTFRVWGASEQECVAEATLIIKAAQLVNLPSGSIIGTKDLTLSWLNDLVAVVNNGRKLEFTLNFPIPVPNVPKRLTYVTNFTGSVAMSLETGTIPESAYPILSGSWQHVKQINVSGSH